jgi:predicted nucleic acid-binding protein
MLARSTDIVIDTCSILNAINSNSLELICSLPFQFYIGPIVYGECTKQPCPELERQLKSGKIKLLGGNIFPVSVFAGMSQKHNLGDGETECICYGKVLAYNVCSDDRKARDSITAELTTDYLVGSIGLLKIATEKSVISCVEAFSIYQIMKSKGAFLPHLASNYFC